jgi:hypothetical protein
MLTKLLPRSCSRLRVFLSYAHQQRAIAEEIAQALVNAGHSVFFDVNSIPGSADYIDKIQCSIENSDRFVLLASQEALAPGKFVMTELQFAKERFPSPAGKVLPVMIDPRVGIGDLPVYLRSVSVLNVSGNAPAEVVAAINKTREVGTLCKSVTLAGVLAVASTAAFAVLDMSGRLGGGSGGADVALLPPEHIHFRSLEDAPIKLEAPGASMKWIDTAVTVTVMPVAFVHRSEPGRRVRILSEAVTLTINGKAIAFRPVHVVEITDQKCGDRWYCIKGNAGVETLDPGQSIRRETMFIAKEDGAPSWRTVVNDIIKQPNMPITVRFEAKVETVGSPDAGSRILSVDCRIDTLRLNAQVKAQGYIAEEDIKPLFLEPDCNVITPDPVKRADAKS